MNRLLKFEFRKLFRQKSFYICGAIMLGLIFISALTMNLMYEVSQNLIEVTDEVNIMANFDSGLSGLYMLSTALSNSNFTIIFAVFISLFVCGDYTNGTLKNVIARGYGRISIYISKYLVSLIAATIYTIFCWVIGFLSGTVLWGVGSLPANETTLNFVTILLVQLLSAYAYTSMFFLIAALLKKTGGSIAVGIIAPVVIVMIISLLDVLTNKITFSFSDYWLDNCFINISATSVPSDIMLRCFACFLIYTVIFAVAGHLIGTRNEV
jgi:ABC-2 type transport system permease protein